MLTRADDDPVADLMQRWSGPEWTRTADFAEAVDRYRAASRIPQAAYGAMEYHRWAARSQLRPDGLRYARRMAAPVTAPTLQLHGELDACVLPSTARGSGRYVAGAYEWRELPGIGHFPQEEAPDVVSRGHHRVGRADRLSRYSQGPVPTSASAVLPVAGGVGDLLGGERVAGVRVVDRRGEDDAEDRAVGGEQRAAGVAGADGRRTARRRRGRRSAVLRKSGPLISPRSRTRAGPTKNGPPPG